MQGNNQPITACKQYCLAAGATQGNIAYTQTVMGNLKRHSGSRKADHLQVTDKKVETRKPLIKTGSILKIHKSKDNKKQIK